MTRILIAASLIALPALAQADTGALQNGEALRAPVALPAGDFEWRYVPVRRLTKQTRRHLPRRLRQRGVHRAAPKKKPVVCGCKSQWERTKPH